MDQTTVKVESKGTECGCCGDTLDEPGRRLCEACVKEGCDPGTKLCLRDLGGA